MKCHHNPTLIKKVASITIFYHAGENVFYFLMLNSSKYKTLVHYTTSELLLFTTSEQSLVHPKSGFDLTNVIILSVCNKVHHPLFPPSSPFVLSPCQTITCFFKLSVQQFCYSPNNQSI